MRIGTIQAMRLVADLFDSFCAQRDLQRNIAHMKELRAWADKEGKELVILANSGCLANCPGQIFHDNMVAHEPEVARTVNIENWLPYVCWRAYKDKTNWVNILQSTWIRPEDLRLYEPYAHIFKLATRMHGHPRMVVDAYTRGRFRGNLMDLTEPGFSSALEPHVILNENFPADWAERTSTCDRRCHACGYCESALRKVLVNISGA